KKESGAVNKAVLLSELPVNVTGLKLVVSVVGVNVTVCCWVTVVVETDVLVTVVVVGDVTVDRTV
ncbi:MAG: hypothetical protein PHD14_04620, partial [Dehalococcoidales bacterium]|nr:hypothetical protein [Dehalococcoidales bacterium]